MTSVPLSTYPRWLDHKVDWGSDQVPLNRPQLKAIFSVLNRIQFDGLKLPTCLERNQLGIIRTVFCLDVGVFCISSEVEPSCVGTRKKCYKSVLIDLENRTANAVALLVFSDGHLAQNSIKAWRSLAPSVGRYIRIYQTCDIPALNQKLIIQELFDGDAFDHRDAKLRYNLSRSDRLRVCYQVARQVKKLHARKLAHFDIKSENILLKMQGGRVKAALIDYEYIYTNEQFPFKGTPGFLAPEIIIGLFNGDFASNQNHRFAADIWALGLTFYEFLFDEVIWTEDLEPHAETLFSLIKTRRIEAQTQIHRLLITVIRIMRDSRENGGDDPLSQLIASMTDFEHANRPNILTVCSTLYRLLKDEPIHIPISDSGASTPRQSESDHSERT